MQCSSCEELLLPINFNDVAQAAWQAGEDSAVRCKKCEAGRISRKPISDMKFFTCQYCPSCKGAHTGKTQALEDLEADRLSPFECNICFELANDAVITMCGHMYCWVCLYR